MTLPEPYYTDDWCTIYHGDCRDIIGELTFDLVVTDPPYGRGWKQGRLKPLRNADDSHAGIIGDRDTSTRDEAMHQWGFDRPAIVFGDLMLPPPAATRQVLVYRKPPNAGTRGAMGGFRRDAEAIYLVGKWPSGLGGCSSIVATSEPSQGNPSSPQGRYGHPHTKPVDVMVRLISACPHDATVLDPFMGSGTTLRAAKDLGRHAIGIEIEERYCEIAAKRLAQEVLPL